MVQTGSQDILAAGHFEPIGIIEVPAKISGRVEQVFVDVGDRVRSGEMLAFLDVPEIESGLVDLRIWSAGQREAQAESENWRAQAGQLRLETQIGAHSSQPLSRALAEARRRTASAEARLGGANTALSAATSAGLENLDSAIITAPREGIIWRCVAPGTVLSGPSRSAVVELAQDDLLRLKVALPKDVTRQLHIRQIIYVHAASFKETFPGMVVKLADRSGRGTMEAEVDLLNKNLVLTPGMIGSIEVPLRARANVVTVPVTAVTEDRTHSKVLILDGQNRIQTRVIETGNRGNELVEVTQALREGERVVDGKPSGF